MRKSNLYPGRPRYNVCETNCEILEMWHLQKYF
jgi:hypothetical protein